MKLHLLKMRVPGGLILISENVELHMHPQSEILLTWFASGLVIASLSLLGQWLISRCSQTLRWGKALSRHSSSIISFSMLVIF